MQYAAELLGRRLGIALTRMATHALQAATTPLHVEMELYFSCLIRKRVHFHRPPRPDAVSVADTLTLSFRPVMSRGGCLVADGEPEGLLVDLPTGEPHRFVPHWLRLDYRKGQWLGEFGYRAGGMAAV